MYLEQEYEKTFVSLSTPKGALELPESKPDQWDYAKNRWTTRNSSLSTYNWLIFFYFVNFDKSEENGWSVFWKIGIINRCYLMLTAGNVVKLGTFLLIACQRNPCLHLS